MARSTGILKVMKASGPRWRARWIGPDGKRRSMSFRTEGAARAALRRHQTEVDDVRSGRARPEEQRTVATAYAAWIVRRPPATRRDNDSRFRTHILPLLGERRLADITNDTVEELARHLEAKVAARPGQRSAKPLRPQTVKHALVALRKFLADHGVELRVRYKLQPADYSWIRTPEEVSRFLDACRPEWFRIAATLAVYGGLRLGEVAGLRRDALDFDRGMMRVDRSFDGPTKSKQARWVPLAPALASVLRPWLLAHPGPLVVTKEGAPLAAGTTLTNEAERACKRAGIPRVTFHQLRHTAASHLAQRVSLPLVGAILGWLYVRTGSLPAAIVVHAFFNAMNLAVLRLS